jgi:molybdate transport system regulatory protein
MNLSARNILAGTVTSVKEGAVMAEIVIALDGGEQVVAAITVGAEQALSLQAGTKVYAVVKATEVLLATEGGPKLVLSARNQLPGTVTSVTEGVVTAEVGVTLAGGAEVVAVITVGSVRNLGLQAGGAVTVIIKATEVLVATAG